MHSKTAIRFSRVKSIGGPEVVKLKLAPEYNDRSQLICGRCQQRCGWLRAVYLCRLHPLHGAHELIVLLLAAGGSN